MNVLVISEGKIPGAMLLTRMLTAFLRSSCARSVVRWMSAALDTLYLKWCWEVRVMPDMEEMLMMVPVCPGRVAALSRGMKAAEVKKWLEGG